MNSKDYFILIVIFVMLFAALFGSHVQAQKVSVDKKVEIINETNKPDSSVVIVKTTKSNKSVNGDQGVNIDSLIQVFYSGNDTVEGQTIKIMTIHNGNTIIKESHSDTFDPNLFQEFNPENLEKGMFKSMEQLGFEGDSLFHWPTGFDSLVDPLNFNLFDKEWTGNMDEMDSIMEQHFKFNDDENGNQMIVFNDNGNEIRIEQNGQKVYINKNDDGDSIQSDIKVIKKVDSKKIDGPKSHMELDELTDNEKADLKSKGVKTSTKEPEFEYLKFYPNPSEGSINIEFHADKPIDTEVRITNMTGKIFFEEKLNNFSGDYNKSINLTNNGAGTYLLQIVQGKKAITRKIVVD